MLDLSHYERQPCPFAPGSPEKVAVLILRASKSLPLFVAGDVEEGESPAHRVRANPNPDAAQAAQRFEATQRRHEQRRAPGNAARARARRAALRAEAERTGQP